MSVTKDVLDDIARRYHQATDVPDKHIEDLCQDYSVEWMLKRLEGRKRVLELGYGEGILNEALLKAGHDVTLVEGSDLLIQEAREKYGDRMDIHHTLFEEFHPTQPFDAVVASHVLEHVDDPVAIMKKVHGWLAPDGIALVIVPNAESIHRRLAVIMGLTPALDTLGARDHLVGHQRVYDYKGLEADLKTSGFKVTEAGGYFLKVLPNGMMLSYSQELLMALNTISETLPKEMLANLAVVAALDAPG